MLTAELSSSTDSSTWLYCSPWLHQPHRCALIHRALMSWRSGHLHTSLHVQISYISRTETCGLPLCYDDHFSPSSLATGKVKVIARYIIKYCMELPSQILTRQLFVEFQEYAEDTIVTFLVLRWLLSLHLHFVVQYKFFVIIIIIIIEAWPL